MRAALAPAFVAWIAASAACGHASSPEPSTPAPPSPAPESSAAPADTPPPAPATRADDAGAPAPPPEPSATSASAPEDAGPPPFDMAIVEGVLKEHKEALRQACWVHAKSAEKAYIGTVTLRIGPTGIVVSAKTDGTDAPTSKCIDKQVKGWKFPAPGGTATVKMPVRLRRD